MFIAFLCLHGDYIDSYESHKFGRPVRFSSPLRQARPLLPDNPAAGSVNVAQPTLKADPFPGAESSGKSPDAIPSRVLRQPTSGLAVYEDIAVFTVYHEDYDE
jgi:hypothetical protein